MKNFIIFTILLLTLSGFTFAQSRLPELNKVKKIKLLESTRDDVKKILKGYETDDADAEDFSTANAYIEISYSFGDCSDDSVDTDEWNIPKGKVTKIEISLKEPFTFKDIGISSSSLRKEQRYYDAEDSYIYYDKGLGIGFEVDEDNIETIYLFPTISYYSSLCDNEEASKIKEFYSTESWFGNTNLEDRSAVIEEYPSPMVDSLTLSANEIIIGCSNAASNKSCADTNWEISVNTSVSYLTNDVLTYEYTISGGKIIGEGKQVIWDLWGVAPGTYTITAGVNDGCGICGQTKTQTVVVKECSDCSRIISP